MCEQTSHDPCRLVRQVKKVGWLTPAVENKLSEVTVQPDSPAWQAGRGRKDTPISRQTLAGLCSKLYELRIKGRKYKASAAPRLYSGRKPH